MQSRELAWLVLARARILVRGLPRGDWEGEAATASERAASERAHARASALSSAVCMHACCTVPEESQVWRDGLYPKRRRGGVTGCKVPEEAQVWRDGLYPKSRKCGVTGCTDELEEFECSGCEPEEERKEAESLKSELDRFAQRRLVGALLSRIYEALDFLGTVARPDAALL